MPMVLLQQLTIRELRGTARDAAGLDDPSPAAAAVRRRHDRVGTRRRTPCSSANAAAAVCSSRSRASPGRDAVERHRRLPGRRRSGSTPPSFVDLPANGTRQFVVKLPSPMVPERPGRDADVDRLCRARVPRRCEFWSKIPRARRAVPRPGTSRQRALPRQPLARAAAAAPSWRRRAPTSPSTCRIPTSRTARPARPGRSTRPCTWTTCSTTCAAITPSPAEELEAQFRNNQEADGHVSGYANWLVYTPAMLYAVAQNYLLSNDRAELRAAAAAVACRRWTGASRRCARSRSREGPRRRPRARARSTISPGRASGRSTRRICSPGSISSGARSNGTAIRAPPRRGRRRLASASAIARGFGAASARSPLVQLRDGTWMPYVPAEALTPRRLLDQWYATDVDTGAVHLLRLKALPAHRRAGRRAAATTTRTTCSTRAGASPTSRSTTSTPRRTCCATSRKRWCARSTATWPAPSATQRLRTGGAPLDARPVLRTAEHRRRVVRALPQHARPRARRRRAGARRRRLRAPGCATGRRSSSSARRPTTATSHRDSREPCRRRRDSRRRPHAIGRASEVPAVWCGSVIPTASACKR